jgi:hypothetical protein
MATKKNNKKAMKSKAASGKQVTVGRHAPKKNTPKKLATMKKRRTSAKKKIAATAKASGKTTRRDRQPEIAALAQETVGLRSGEQSGDLQGLRDVESADSESVGELLEEGNAFEAGVVTGVEDAEDDEESEVRTHEVPEHDVPGEYDDKD